MTDHEVARLFDFICLHRLASDHNRVVVVPSDRDLVLPEDPRFERVEPREDQVVDLNVGFLCDNVVHNDALLARNEVPLLLVGHRGLPHHIDHVCVPFEGKRFHGNWLRHVLDVAGTLRWKVRLVHGDHGFVTHEIIKFASWLRLDAVKEAMRDWLTDDLRTQFRDYLASHPDTEVTAGVGKLKTMLADEDPNRMMIMGSRQSGFHLPNRHHRLHYGALLTETGASGYFLDAKRKP